MSPTDLVHLVAVLALGLGTYLGVLAAWITYSTWKQRR